MPGLIEKATGKVWPVPADEMEAALSSGLYEPPSVGEVTVTATVIEPGTAPTDGQEGQEDLHEH